MKVSRKIKRSFLIGTYLGDSGSKSRERKTKDSDYVSIVIGHGRKQTDYLLHKKRLFEFFFNVKVHYNSKYNRIATPHIKRCRVVKKWFSCNGKKDITDKIAFFDHPIGLAYLLCDDGSVMKRKKKHKDGSIYYLRPTMTIATHGFSEEGVKKLIKHLQDQYQIDSYINWERRRGVSYPRLWINADNSEKLWKLVSEYIPRVKSMLYKFSFIIERYGFNGKNLIAEI